MIPRLDVGPSLRTIARFIPVMVVVAFTCAGCRSRQAAPEAAGGTNQMNGQTGGSTAAGTGFADAAGGPDPRAAAAEPAPGPDDSGPLWASWPIPNSPSTGLPNPASYEVSPRGVVVDKVTGLMWQRGVDPKNYSWRQARDVCRRLDLAGHDDWRLPSRIELVSIVDLTHSQPSIDQHAFPHTPSDWFWTSSVEAVNPAGAAWYVYFYFGYPKVEPTNSVFRVRCVRAPQSPGAGQPSPPTPSYEERKETVRDRGTGLTWQRKLPTQTFSFEAAHQYCASQRLGRERGWRVPSMGELLSLVDERTFNPTIDAKAFPETPSQSFWTSSVFADTPSMAWHVDFEHGNALYGLLKGLYRVRCVR